MAILNTNDYLILNKVVDTERNLGSSRLRGITIEELANRTGLSTTKIRTGIKKLLDEGFVDNAVKRVKSNAYHITEKGLNEIEAVTINYLEEDIKDGN